MGTMLHASHVQIKTAIRWRRNDLSDSGLGVRLTILHHSTESVELNQTTNRKLLQQYMLYTHIAINIEDSLNRSRKNFFWGGNQRGKNPNQLNNDLHPLN